MSATNSSSFRYKAMTNSGATEAGYISADSKVDATQKLTQLGKKPIEVSQANARTLASPRSGTNSLLQQWSDQSRFYADVAVMLEAGFNIDQAMDAVFRAERNPRQKEFIGEILSSISAGTSVSHALSERQEIPRIVAALVKSGENSGQMGTVFSVIADDFKKRAKRRSELLEAILYPGILVTTLFGTLIILSMYLVPEIEPIFDDSGLDKPFVVGFLSGLGTVLSNYWPLMMLSLLCCLLLVLSAPRVGVLERFFERLALRFPVFGDLIRQSTISRYLSSLSLLLKHKVPFQTSLKLAADTAPFTTHRSMLTLAHDDLAEGKAFWQAIERTGLFEDNVVSLIKLGEESNSLAPVTERAAVLLDTDYQRTVKRFLTLLTPTITIVLGIIIGSLVVTVMTALLSINEVAIQ